MENFVNANKMEKIDMMDEKIVVPPEFINYPLGFVIDAGCSVIKLIYRSNFDYTNCKPRQANQREAILRLRCFSVGDHEKLIEFIKDHVDICVNNISQETNTEGCVVTDCEKEAIWWQTGVITTHFKRKLETSLKIKTNLLSEMQANAKIAKILKNENILKIKPLSRHAVQYMAERGKHFLSMMDAMSSKGDSAFISHSSHKNKEADAIVTKLTELVYETKIDEIIQQLNAIKISFPCISLIGGSAFVIIRIEEDGSYKPVDLLTCGGKTFLALGEELTGAKDFDDLINMAKRGDTTKVDVSYSDLQNTDHQENDWYSSTPNDFLVFNMGKLSKHNVFKPEKYSKDDLAAGHVNMFCEHIAKWVLLNASLQNVQHVCFTGSFVKDDFVKERLERSFLCNSLLASVQERIFINAHFLSNPGFVCGLGVWLKNVEDQGKPT